VASSMPAALSGSYHALTADKAEVFRLLGIAPGTDMSLSAAAALVGRSPNQTSRILRGLEQLSLIQQPKPGRFRLHDLVRLYAADRAQQDQPAERTELALRRIADFYTHTAFVGDQLLNPDRLGIDIGTPTYGSQPLALPDVEAALAWFDSEHKVLLAVQQLATRRGWHRTVWSLAWTLNTFHWRLGLVHDDLAACRAGAAATNALDDPKMRIPGGGHIAAARPHSCRTGRSRPGPGLLARSA
jgi:hypothetical protein